MWKCRKTANPRTTKISVLATVVLLSSAVIASSVRATPVVTSFGVGDYSNCPSSNVPGMRDGAIYFYGYLNWLGYEGGRMWTDSQVKAKYLRDASSTGDGEDWNGFDPDGVDGDKSTISYFAGHGSCGGGKQGRTTPAQFCSTSSQCAPTPAGLRTPGICRNRPGQAAECHWAYDHKLITCASSSEGQKLVDYSLNGAEDEINLGEGVWPGNWAGYGSDGSLKAALFDTSCGVHVGTHYQDLAGAMAGISLLGAVHVVYGDTAATSERGLYAGALAYYFPYATVTNIWNMVTSYTNAGSGCSIGTGTDGGINGCGGHLIMSIDSTQSQAQSKHSRTWLNLETTQGALGTGWYYYYYSCNYDCNANPIVL